MSSISKISARFAQAPAKVELPGALRVRQSGREVEVIANGEGDRLLALLQSQRPEELRTEALTLEEIFVVCQTQAPVRLWPSAT